MSGWFTDADATVTVALEECLCPGTPHSAGDTVDLLAELDLETGFAVLAEVAQDERGSAVERLGRAYLRAGIRAWSFVDGKGTPVPVTPENIARLRWTPGTYLLADRAAQLYGEAILLPLARRVSESSQSGLSDDSTSPVPGS